MPQCRRPCPATVAVSPALCVVVPPPAPPFLMAHAATLHHRPWSHSCSPLPSPVALQANTYQSSLSFTGTSCTSWSNCGIGTFSQTAPTATSNRVSREGGWPPSRRCFLNRHPMPTSLQPSDKQGCAACTSGFQDALSHTSTSCKTWATCSSGYYVTQDPTATSNRLCGACAAGTYQPSSGYTGKTCTACSATTYQNSAGQASCKACTAGYYRSSATAQTGCQAGYQCSGCIRTACAPGTFQDLTLATSCKTW